MRARAVMLTFAFCGAILPAQLHAQFAGKWVADLGEWQAEGGGDVQIRGANSGTLDLTMKGDSVIGTWVGASGNPAPLELRGRMEGQKVVLKGQREGRVNLNGQESTVLLAIEYELTASAGALTGLMRMKREGEPAVWRSLTGRRAS
jgi:hypothetical protein